MFDSGIGGLSVLKEITSRGTTQDVIYLGDRARAPFGRRGLDDVSRISHEIVDWLLEKSCETIVIACNTASAAALETLRRNYPGVVFVGMEPAVKPAARETRSGVVCILATEATFQGRLYQATAAKYAGSSRLLTMACPQWVELVEAGEISGGRLEKSVSAVVGPVVDQGADRLVLGCTHFSFLQPAIRSSAGPAVEILDPAPAVASQTLRLATGAPGTGTLTLAASGDRDEFARLAWLVAGIKTSQPVLPFPS